MSDKRTKLDKIKLIQAMATIITGIVMLNAVLKGNKK